MKAIGKLGGKARAKKLTKEQLSAIGRLGVKAKRKKKYDQRSD
jgi:hypothetical protein